MARLTKYYKDPKQLFSRPRSRLNKIFSHTQNLIQLQNALRRTFPGEVYVASLEEGTLHLITPSASLATRLKYRQSAIKAALEGVEILGSQNRKTTIQVEQINISVRPNFKLPTPLTKPAIAPTRQAARHIAETAQYIEDEPLRKALIKLSKRGEP
jgi:hypothetical protein